MKKVSAFFLLLVYVMSINSALIASDKNPQDNPHPKKTWADFKMAKAEAEEAKAGGDLETITGKLLVLADISTSLERPDISAWQYNNIAYYSIEEFKKKTDYANLMSKVESATDEKDKSALIDGAKKVIGENISILTTAKEYLEKARKLDEGLTVDRKDENRTNAISNNIGFIDWVNNFIMKKAD
jgi:hypothetical protein